MKESKKQNIDTKRGKTEDSEEDLILSIDNTGLNKANRD
jgi:hypothetical protein